MICRFFLPLLSVAALSGCASISTHGIQPTPVRSRAPEVIYVQDFAAPQRAFRVDRDEQKTAAFRAAMAGRLSDAVVERLQKRLGVKAVRLKAGEMPPRANAWLVSGHFVRVNQGSRALRAVVGFGLGATKMETAVEVHDLRTRKPTRLLRFETTGGTNSQPGAAPGLVFPNYWLLAADTLVRLGPGLSTDLIRTSRQIVAVLSEYMAEQGHLPPENVYRAKKLGQWP